MRPTDFFMPTTVLSYIWQGIFVLTLPCVFIHCKIICSAIFCSSQKPKDMLLVNLAIGACVFTSAVGTAILEFYYPLWSSDLACGVRGVQFRLGLIIVIFTHARIVHEARNSLYKKPFWEQTSSIRNFLTVVAIDATSILLLLPILFSRSYDTDQEKCVRDTLLDTEWVDWLCRFLQFIFIEVMPCCMQFNALREIVEFTRKQADSLDPEFGVFVQKKRIRMIKSSFAFTFLFVFVSLPSTMLDIFYSASVSLPQSAFYYRNIALCPMYFLSYLMVSIFPVYVFFTSRDKLYYS